MSEAWRADPKGTFWPSLGRVICDDREDPEQSPCIGDPGHGGDHQDEYGERWGESLAVNAPRTVCGDRVVAGTGGVSTVRGWRHAACEKAPRHPRGTCCWCGKRKAHRWFKTNDSTPSHTKREGRCWFCWRRLPSHSKVEVED